MVTLVFECLASILKLDTLYLAPVIDCTAMPCDDVFIGWSCCYVAKLHLKKWRPRMQIIKGTEGSLSARDCVSLHLIANNVLSRVLIAGLRSVYIFFGLLPFCPFVLGAKIENVAKIFFSSSPSTSFVRARPLPFN